MEQREETGQDWGEPIRKCFLEVTFGRGFEVGIGNPQGSVMKRQGGMKEHGLP